MMRMVYAIVASLLVACGGAAHDTSSAVSPAPETEAAPPPAAAQPDVGAPPAVERELSKVALSEMMPPFPASVALPEGMKTQTDWARSADDNGLRFEYSVASVELPNGRELRFELLDDDRAAKAERLRTDETREHVLDKQGSDGAWFSALASTEPGQCTVSGVHPKTRLACSAGAVPCNMVETLADVCLSLRPTSGKRVERRGGDAAFSKLEDAAARAAAFSLASALTENNHKEIIKLWGPNNVKVYGKRVNQKSAIKGMAAAKSARLYFRIPCAGVGAPGEPRTEDGELPKVRGQGGEQLETESCAWHAYASKSGGVDLFPIDTTNAMPVLQLAKDRVGQWKLVEVRYGDTDPYNPDADEEPEANARPLVPTKEWPFYKWDSARAYTYNLQPYGPSESIIVYGQRGWVSTIKEQKPIAKELADRALALVRKTEGEMNMSKCAFPRHAIVFFWGEQPVASANVCFECEDLLVWPAYHKDPKRAARKQKQWQKYGKIYMKLFPEWKSLFESDIGFPTDWTKLPGANVERRHP